MSTCGVLGMSPAGHDVPYHRPTRKALHRDGALPVPEGRMTREELFLSELALIERVIAWVCARRCLRGADGEDFASTVKLRLIENDYDVLARFEGRSSLKTYLTMVVNRLYLDYQRERFGKWRSSAQARRLGPLALRLEALLYRDRLPFEEALGVLQTDVGVAETREALHELSLKLPRRNLRRDGVGGDPEPSEARSGHSVLDQADREALARKIFLVLKRALGRLPARDRIILRLHIEDGLTLAAVAKSLGEQQKALYRKRDALLNQLRVELEADGIRDRDARELLETLDWDAALTVDGPARGSSVDEAWSPPSVTDGQTRREGEP